MGFFDTFKSLDRLYEESGYGADIAEENAFMRDFLTQYEKDRLEQAMSGADRARLGIERQGNLAGFTGTSLLGEQIGRSTSNIMSGAQSDISQLGSQVDMALEANLESIPGFRDALKAKRNQQRWGLGAAAAGLGLMFVPGMQTAGVGLMAGGAGTMFGGGEVDPSQFKPQFNWWDTLEQPNTTDPLNTYDNPFGMG